MLAERHRDRREIVARRAIFEHVPARAEGMLRYRTEMSELRAVLPRPLGGGNQIVLRQTDALIVGTRPAVAPVSAHDGGREAGFDGHHGQNYRHDLARAAIVEGCAEDRVDAEPGGH